MRMCRVARLLVLLALLAGGRASAQFTALNGRPVARPVFEQFLRKQVDSLGLVGLSVAVIDSGKIVYHGAFGVANLDTGAPVDDESIFEAASMSKTVFAYMVMRMVDKGLLDLDKPLYQYLPYADIARDERYKAITARMVLTHHAGFPNWRYFNRADTSLHVHFPDLYLAFDPGTRYGYSGEGFLYLAQVVAHLNGLDIRTLSSLYDQEVAQPLGMTRTWFTGNAFISQHKVSGHMKGKVSVSHNMNWPISFPTWDSSYVNPAASLHTNAESYARFVLALMNGTGLSRKSLDEMLRAQYPLPDSLAENPAEHPAIGLGIFMTTTPYGISYDHGGDNGNFKSHFVWYRDQKKAFVYFVNSDRGDLLNARLKAFLATGQ